MKNRRRTILIAENDRGVAQAIRFHLERAGFTVFVAHDGDQAAILAARQRFELIITNLDLPGMSGGEFCRHVRDELKLTEIPIAIIAGESFGQDTAALVFMCGISRVFYRPIDPELMVEFAAETVDYILTTMQ